MGSDWKMSAIKALNEYEQKQRDKDDLERQDRERRREGARNNCRKYLALLLGIDPLDLPEGGFTDTYGVPQPRPIGQDQAWEGVFEDIGWRVEVSSAQNHVNKTKPPTSWSGVRARWGREQWTPIPGKVALGRFLKKNGVQ